jgi:hypothetical protein
MTQERQESLIEAEMVKLDVRMAKALRHLLMHLKMRGEMGTMSRMYRMQQNVIEKISGP